MWKAIGQFPGYEVSTDGAVRTHIRRSEPLVMRLKPNSNGYMRVYLWRADRQKYTWRMVHALVLETFVGARPQLHDASHLNGDRTDNRLANLAWESRSANHLRKRDHGTIAHGSRNGNATLTEDAVRQIRASYATGGVTQARLAQLHGVSQRTVSCVVRRIVWAHVP